MLRFASSSSPLLVECIPHFLNLSKHCPSQGSLVLTVYALGNHETHPLSGKGIICIWDMLSPNYPINILVADGDLTCACFAAEQLYFVAAGSREGNVFAWDLREARSARSLQMAAHLGVQCALRYPSYSTHLTDAYTQIHTSSVVTIAPVPHSSAPVSRGHLSLQFSSLDDRGLLCYWLLSETDQAKPDNSTDHGLQVGSSVRISCSRSLFVGEDDGAPNALRLNLDKLSMHEMLRSISPGPSVIGMSMLPWEPNRFLVQTVDAGLLHRSRFGNPGPPRAYSCDAFASPSLVTTVHFSPHVNQYFLAGCSDGSVRLHNHATAQPLTTWSAMSIQSLARGVQSPFDDFSRSIVQVQWSSERPAVFFVLDVSGNLHAFDLLQSDKSPVLSEKTDMLRGDLPGARFIATGHFPSCPGFIAMAMGPHTKVSPLAAALVHPFQNEHERLQAYLGSLL